MKRIIIAVIGIGILAGCKPKEEQNFRVDLEHFFGVEGFTLHYVANQDSLKLYYNCDFEGCKDTLIYQTMLDKKVAADFFSFLTDLKYDTLKNSYETSGFDGRYTTVQISGSSIPNKTIRLVRYEHETVEKLIDRVDLLIPEVKYRLYSYKYEE